MVALSVLESAFRRGTPDGPRLRRLSIDIPVSHDIATEVRPRLAWMYIETTPIYLSPTSIAPIVRAEASEVYRGALDAIVALQKALERCQPDRDSACITRVRTSLDTKAVALLRSLRASDKPRTPGDRLLEGWLDAPRASGAGPDSAPGQPGEDSPIAILARESRPTTPVGFAARYFYAEHAPDPKIQARLYDELIAAPIPGGFSRAEILFRRAHLETDPAKATPLFRVAAGAAQKAASDGGPSDLFIELVIGCTWAISASEFDANAALEGVSLATHALGALSAKGERYPGIGDKLASAIARSMMNARPLKADFSVPKRVFMDSAKSLTAQAHRSGDLELETRFRALAKFGAEATLTGAPWNEVATRAATIRLHDACASEVSPPIYLSKTPTAKIHLTHSANTTTMKGRGLPPSWVLYTECIERRGPRILWNAPDFDADLGYHQP